MEHFSSDEIPEYLAKGPGCYRHPDRATLVSCGRCGKPLCPDCVLHGPVGVRCAECLSPSGGQAQFKAQAHAPASAPAPVETRRAMGIVLGLAVLWIVALWYSGSFTQTQSPNLLIAGCAGGVEGWLLWRLVGRTWDRTTRYWALAIGAGMPLVAGLILLAKLLLAPSIMDESLLAVLIRLVAAIVISTFFAWMFATQPRR